MANDKNITLDQLKSTAEMAVAEIDEKIAAKEQEYFSGTIGTSWTENEDTGVKSQNVAIAGITAKDNVMIDHLYNKNGTSEGYAAFVEEENQYLQFITNGYAETYDGGVTFHIFGDAPTVSIPIIVEVV